MTPLLDDGDSILVNINYNKMVADGIYVINMNGTLRVKKLQLLLSDQKILVQSINPNYQEETLDDSDNLVIVGKVCWVGKKIK